jgi:hypothetical protein
MGLDLVRFKTRTQDLMILPLLEQEGVMEQEEVILVGMLAIVDVAETKIYEKL